MRAWVRKSVKSFTLHLHVNAENFEEWTSLLCIVAMVG